MTKNFDIDSIQQLSRGCVLYESFLSTIHKDSLALCVTGRERNERQERERVVFYIFSVRTLLRNELILVCEHFKGLCLV